MNPKCILISACVVLSTLANLSAQSIYSETFDTDPGYIGAIGPDDSLELNSESDTP